MIILYPKNSLREFFLNAQTTNEYKDFLEDFKRKGSETFRYEEEDVVIHIYTPELAYVLTLNQIIPTDNFDNGSKEVLDTIEFLDYFYEGFKNGLNAFQKEFELSPDIIYGRDISNYLEDLKFHCFKKNIKHYKQGWSFVRLHFPLTFQKELIIEYGYYSGLVRSIDELIEKKPSLFGGLLDAKKHFLNCFPLFDGNHFLAGAATAIRVVKSPNFLKEQNVVFRKASEIERLMYDDSKKLISIEEFKTKTRYIFDLVSPDKSMELFEYLLNRATDHLSIKKTELDLGTGMYIDENKVKIGRTTIISEFKKTPKENISVKINTLEVYLNWLKETFQNFNGLPPQPTVKQKPEPNGKLITFKNNETIHKIHSELKGYFPNKEAELLKVLQGEQLSELLLFPHNQNKFVEVFRRLKYNGFLLNTDTETKNWICTTFQFVKKRFVEPQPFNESSVWDNLNKGRGEPTKKERICITEWLPYKSPLKLTMETENEKL